MASVDLDAKAANEVAAETPTAASIAWHSSVSATPIGLGWDIEPVVLDWFGAAGQAWLERLPETVERLAAKWGLSIDGPLGGGSASLVLAALRRDGTPAVLKVPFVEEENRSEADALLHYGGVGAVRLYETDRACGALLLERLTPGLSLAAHPHVDEIPDIACRVLRRIWHPPDPGHPFLRVRDLAAGWADELGQGLHIQAEVASSNDDGVVEAAPVFVNGVKDGDTNDELHDALEREFLFSTGTGRFFT